MIKFEKAVAKIKKNPVISALVLVVTVVMTLSSFTDATKNLLDLIPHGPSQVNINGVWGADVSYEWNSNTTKESFSFEMDGNNVNGLASFLSVKRQIEEGKLDGHTLIFDTRSQEMGSRKEKERDMVHHYVGAVSKDEIRFVMQTSGGSSAHSPVEFVAKRLPTKNS